MNKGHVPELSQRLAQLADALGGKAPSPAGLMVWADALDSVEFDDVKAALTDWPKRNTKMPAPADIRKVATERVSSRIEERSRKENAAPGFDLDNYKPNSEVARRELLKIRAILNAMRPDPKAWAHKLKAKEESGEALSLIQRQAWREALGESA